MSKRKAAVFAALLAVMLGRALASETKTLVFEVEGLVCEESSRAVEEALDDIDGIVYVEVDLHTKEVTVDSKPGKVAPKQIVEAINAAHDSKGSFTAKLKKRPTTRSPASSRP